jgi:formylmethanofuran dehydrogenase subunit E
MPINVTCSGCGRKSIAPDSAAGSKAQCKGCRTILTIPGTPKPKFCAACGTDVSQRKRTKDERGDYYCEPCWAAKAQAPAEGAAPADEILHYPCHVCDTLFTADEVYDEGAGRMICKPCWEARQQQPQPADGLELADAAPAAAQAGDLFCEGCNRLFPPEKLKLSKSGAVLCKQCSKARERERVA